MTRRVGQWAESGPWHTGEQIQRYLADNRLAARVAQPEACGCRWWLVVGPHGGRCREGHAHTLDEAKAAADKALRRWL